MLVDRAFTTRHKLEIVEEGGRCYAYRYTSYCASIVGGTVEYVERADEPLDVTPLPLNPGEAREYIVTRMPDLQTSDYKARLARLMA